MARRHQSRTVVRRAPVVGLGRAIPAAAGPPARPLSRPASGGSAASKTRAGSREIGEMTHSLRTSSSPAWTAGTAAAEIEAAAETAATTTAATATAGPRGPCVRFVPTAAARVTPERGHVPDFQIETAFRAVPVEVTVGTTAPPEVATVTGTEEIAAEVATMTTVGATAAVMATTETAEADTRVAAAAAAGMTAGAAMEAITGRIVAHPFALIIATRTLEAA